MNLKSTRICLNCRLATVCLAVVLISSSGSTCVQRFASAQESNKPDRDELTAALAAKVLASGVFVSKRKTDDVLEKNVYRMIQLFGYRPSDITQYDVNPVTRSVTLQIKNAPPRSARFHGDQGCVVMAHDNDAIHFEPVKLNPRDRSQEAWPTGDQIDSRQTSGEKIDVPAVEAALDIAFGPNTDTAGIVVVHRGHIIAERYGAGADRDTRLESWSMGKSLTAMLYARAIHLQGKKFDPFVPAPIREWNQNPHDPRAKIQIADLLRMSSGLRFSHPSGDQPEAWDHAHADHFYVYSGAINVFEFSRSRPLEHPPGTVGRYRNCDPLIIGSLVKEMVEARGENYLSFPHRALFDEIGIRNIVLEPDPYGNFVSTGYEYGTVRDWARLGLLVLRDGVWNGRRLLPEGFTEFVSTPAPAWPNGEYGGLFWTNANGRWNVPKDAYYMAGHGTQVVLLVPTHDLLIVRMGHQRGGGPGAAALNQALAELMKVIPKSGE